jgi:hypothetical protein
MRCALALLLMLVACGRPSSPPAREVAGDVRDASRTVPISDLHFQDHLLEEIAADLVRRARARGIDVSSGRNRVERLIRLEASLGGSTVALERVNSLAAQVTAHDAGRWAKLRQRADLELSSRDDEVSERVRDLLQRWQLRKTDTAWSHLSSNYKYFIGRDGWEREFHEFISARPADAATWAWLILRDDASSVKQQYGKADAETAYRFYLELSQLGDAREARRTFSVPGIEILEAP